MPAFMKAEHVPKGPSTLTGTLSPI
uniref:Uncharacterized protein n=1 Tax=Anguilla anguilla TaxID=7936 RepID=A0A0E9R0H0_ANGAN